MVTKLPKAGTVGGLDDPCFNESFTKAGGGVFDGLALGIMGDVVRHLEAKAALFFDEEIWKL
jgi:hypothetical protein